MIKRLPPLITSVLECALAPVGVFNDQYQYIYFNQHHVDEVRKIYGVQCYSGISLDDILVRDQESLKSVREIWKKVLEGESLSFIHEIGFRETSTVYEVKYAPVRDEKGLIVGGVHWAKNKTSELIESEEAFRATFDQAAVGLGHASLSGKWLRVNKCFCDLLGYTNEELSEKDFLTITDSLDKEKCQSIYSNLLSGRVSTVSEDKRYVHKNGHSFWVNITATLKKNADNHPQYFIVSVNSIDQLKQYQSALTESQERFRHLANSIPQIAFTMNSDATKVEFCNERWYEYTGLPIDSDCWKQGWDSILHPDDYQTTKDVWDFGAKTGTAYSVEFRLRNIISKEYRWFLCRVVPMKDPTGKIFQWIGTSTDINDQKLVSENLQKNLTLRDDFVSLTSHALKTPLTALSMSAQMIRLFHGKKIEEIPDGNRVLSSLEQIDLQIRRLTKLIDDMLDITQIRSGKLSLTREPFDLGQTVADVMERLRPEILHICRNEPPHLELKSVNGQWDKIRLEQVVVNLVTNALRYGLGKPIGVRVWKNESFAFIAVRDHGIGIAKEDQERIFERFERVVSANEVSGLGVGLFIVKKITEAHGGKVVLKSHPGDGSEFIIELPLEPVNLPGVIDVS